MLPPQSQRQASYARELIEQPVRVVLQMPHPDLLKALEFKPGKTWSSWGTLLNRKVEARVSEVGGREGRGLFAGVRFRRGEVITLYGGELLTAQKAKEVTDHSYMLRISDSLYCIDGSQFANRITERQGERYLPLPGDIDAGVQGAGSLANDARSDAGANAKLEFKALGGRTEGAKLLPRVPMLVATRDITSGEEILFNYGSDKPHLFEDVPSASHPEKRQRLSPSSPDPSAATAPSIDAAASPIEAPAPPAPPVGRMASECESDAGDSLPLIQRPIVLEYFAARTARAQASATEAPSFLGSGASSGPAKQVYRSLGALSELDQQYRSLGATAADEEQDEEEQDVLEDVEVLARLERLPASLTR